MFSSTDSPSQARLVRQTEVVVFGRWGHAPSAGPPAPAPAAAPSLCFPVCDYRHADAGDHSLVVVTSEGEVSVCGSNRHGQLGLGHAQVVLSPVANPYFKQFSLSVSKVACGVAHTAFLVAPGRLFVTGCGHYGRLGVGHTGDVYIPEEVSIPISSTYSTAVPETTGASTRPSSTANMTVIDVACGDTHTLCVTHTSGNVSIGDGSSVSTHVYSFGDGSRGRLGLGGEEDAQIPTVIAAFTAMAEDATHKKPGTQPAVKFNIMSVYAGASHSGAISSRGEAFTWGCGAEGVLGHDRPTCEWVPRCVSALKHTKMTSLSFGARHCLGLDVGGRVYSWGRGVGGVLGLDLADLSVDVCKPTLVSALASRYVVQVSAGSVHSGAVDGRGCVYLWGSAGEGRLGACSEDQHLPMLVPAHELDKYQADEPVVPAPDPAAGGGGGVGAGAQSRKQLFSVGMGTPTLPRVADAGDGAALPLHKRSFHNSMPTSSSPRLQPGGTSGSLLSVAPSSPTGMSKKLGIGSSPRGVVRFGATPLQSHNIVVGAGTIVGKVQMQRFSRDASTISRGSNAGARVDASGDPTSSAGGAGSTSLQPPAERRDAIVSRVFCGDSYTVLECSVFKPVGALHSASRTSRGSSRPRATVLGGKLPEPAPTRSGGRDIRAGITLLLSSERTGSGIGVGTENHTFVTESEDPEKLPRLAPKKSVPATAALSLTHVTANTLEEVWRGIADETDVRPLVDLNNDGAAFEQGNDVIPSRAHAYLAMMQLNTPDLRSDHDQVELAKRVEVAIRRQKRAHAAKLHNERLQAQMRLQGALASPTKRAHPFVPSVPSTPAHANARSVPHSPAQTPRGGAGVGGSGNSSPRHAVRVASSSRDVSGTAGPAPHKPVSRTSSDNSTIFAAAAVTVSGAARPSASGGGAGAGAGMGAGAGGAAFTFGSVSSSLTYDSALVPAAADTEVFGASSPPLVLRTTGLSAPAPVQFFGMTVTSTTPFGGVQASTAAGPSDNSSSLVPYAPNIALAPVSPVKTSPRPRAGKGLSLDTSTPLSAGIAASATMTSPRHSPRARASSSPRGAVTSVGSGAGTGAGENLPLSGTVKIQASGVSPRFSTSPSAQFSCAGRERGASPAPAHTTTSTQADAHDSVSSSKQGLTRVLAPAPPMTSRSALSRPARLVSPVAAAATAGTSGGSIAARGSTSTAHPHPRAPSTASAAGRQAVSPLEGPDAHRKPSLSRRNSTPSHSVLSGGERSMAAGGLVAFTGVGGAGVVAGVSLVRKGEAAVRHAAAVAASGSSGGVGSSTSGRMGGRVYVTPSGSSSNSTSGSGLLGTPVGILPVSEDDAAEKVELLPVAALLRGAPRTNAALESTQPASPYTSSPVSTVPSPGFGDVWIGAGAVPDDVIIPVELRVQARRYTAAPPTRTLAPNQSRPQGPTAIPMSDVTNAARTGAPASFPAATSSKSKQGVPPVVPVRQPRAPSGSAAAPASRRALTPGVHSSPSPAPTATAGTVPSRSPGARLSDGAGSSGGYASGYAYPSPASGSTSNDTIAGSGEGVVVGGTGAGAGAGTVTGAGKARARRPSMCPAPLPPAEAEALYRSFVVDTSAVLQEQGQERERVREQGCDADLSAILGDAWADDGSRLLSPQALQERKGVALRAATIQGLQQLAVRAGLQ